MVDNAKAIGNQIEFGEDVTGNEDGHAEFIIEALDHLTEFLDSDWIETIGEEICNAPTFAEKTNVNFVKVVDDHTLQMITYERGVGMTQACGTGACASVVTAARKGLCSKTAEVILPLGSLKIEIKDDGHVMMEGPSVHVLEGKLY